MMLSTRFSVSAGFRSLAAAATMFALAACGGVQTAGVSGPSLAPDAPVRVALLVPLESGDAGLEGVAVDLVNAARMAEASLAHVNIELEVYADRGTTDGGAAAASRALAEGAQIIVGPLRSTSTAGAQPVAAQAGVNVLSLSNDSSVAGDNVYLLGLTFENTAQHLAGFGLSRGLGNFGVVYPNGIVGEAARNAVAGAVQARGGTVVASQGYNLSMQSIIAESSRIAAALRDAGASAVVLTDGPTGGLSFIADGLRENGLSAESAQFLGLQRWAVRGEALERPSLQGGVFAAPDPALLDGFTARYMAAYGAAPHELASLAYDGVAAVGALVAEARAGGGQPFTAQRLTQPAGFAGVNGPFRFTPDGLNRRNLAIFEVNEGRAVVIERAARNFDIVGN